MFGKHPQSNDSFCSFVKWPDGTLELKFGQGFTKAVIYLILGLSGALAIAPYLAKETGRLIGKASVAGIASKVAPP